MILLIQIECEGKPRESMMDVLSIRDRVEKFMKETSVA